MFWGLIMEPQRRYTQKVRKSFHISMAALDASVSSDEPAQVMCGHKGRTYLLCTLKWPDMLQCSLDLNYEEGSEISFATNGKGNVHLTGYLLEENAEEVVEEEKEKKTLKKKRNADKVNSPPVKKSKLELEDLDFKSVLLGTSMDDDDDDESFTLEDAVESETDEVEDPEENDEDAEEEEDEEDSEEENEVEDEEDEAASEDEDLTLDGEDDEGSSLSEDELAEDIQKLQSAKKAKHVEENGVVSKKKQKVPQKSPKAQSKETKSSPVLKKEVTLQGGVTIEDIKEGEGPPAKNGKFVHVYYEGRLKHNNKVFDATTKGKGFRFRLGAGEVIKGWDVGVAGMKVGGKRRITCPPQMAYGAKGSPPAIPANSTLVFEVELKKVM